MAVSVARVAMWISGMALGSAGIGGCDVADPLCAVDGIAGSAVVDEGFAVGRSGVDVDVDGETWTLTAADGRRVVVVDVDVPPPVCADGCVIDLVDSLDGNATFVLEEDAAKVLEYRSTAGPIDGAWTDSVDDAYVVCAGEFGFERHAVAFHFDDGAVVARAGDDVNGAIDGVPMRGRVLRDDGAPRAWLSRTR